MHYVAHHAWLEKDAGDGRPQRAHLEAVAKQSPFARTKLEGPPFPECLRYLYEWAHELVGRSGVGMSGYAPLTPTVVRDWAAVTDRVVHPHEVTALFALDRAIRTVPESAPTEDDE